MLSNIKAFISGAKNYIIAGLAVAVGVLAAIASWYRASLKSAKLKGEKEARKVENKATDAMVEGLKNENKVTGDISDGKFLD